jgi:hypothetical protein
MKRGSTEPIMYQRHRVTESAAQAAQHTTQLDGQVMYRYPPPVLPPCLAPALVDLKQHCTPPCHHEQITDLLLCLAPVLVDLFEV